MSRYREKGWSPSFVVGRSHAGGSCKQVAICTWNPGESGRGWREIWVTPGWKG